jgi:hypothetical protein
MNSSKSNSRVKNTEEINRERKTTPLEIVLLYVSTQTVGLNLAQNQGSSGTVSVAFPLFRQ